MRRTLLVALLAVAALAALAGAAWWTLRAPDGPATLTVAAGPIGSDGYVLMRSLAEVLERNSDTVRLAVRPTRNSARNVRLLRDGAVDLATVEASVPPVSGVGFVADLFADHFLLAVDAASTIRSVTDLPGHTVAVPEGDTIELRSFWAMIDHYGVPPSSFRFLPVPPREADEAFHSGRADAVFHLSSIRDPGILAFVEETFRRRRPLRFIAIDQAEAMALKRPFLTATTVVKGAFNGDPPLPPRDIGSAALHRLLVARDDAEPDAVAELTRVVFENRLDLVLRMPLASGIAGLPEGGVALPAHEGARRFYERDQPTFLQENAEPMAFVVTIVMLIGSGLLALRRAVLARQKNRADSHNHALLALAHRAREAESVEEVRAVRAELFALMERVVEALDVDKVSEEGFQSFSMIWESVRSLTRDRIAELDRAPVPGTPAEAPRLAG